MLAREMIMSDTTIKKVEAKSSPRGEMGQRYLVAGKRVSMRLWIDEPGGKLKGPTSSDYETVGYVISGSAIGWDTYACLLEQLRFFLLPLFIPRSFAADHISHALADGR